MRLKDYIIIIGCWAVILFFGLLGFYNTQINREEKICEIKVLPIEKIYMHPYGTIEDPYLEGS